MQLLKVLVLVLEVLRVQLPRVLVLVLEVLRVQLLRVLVVLQLLDSLPSPLSGGGGGGGTGGGGGGGTSDEAPHLLLLSRNQSRILCFGAGLSPLSSSPALPHNMFKLGGSHLLDVRAALLECCVMAVGGSSLSVCSAALITSKGSAERMESTGRMGPRLSVLRPIHWMVASSRSLRRVALTSLISAVPVNLGGDEIRPPGPYANVTFVPTPSIMVGTGARPAIAIVSL